MRVGPVFSRRPRRRQTLGGDRWHATKLVAQQYLLRYYRDMPLATARKVEALRADFRSAAQLADMLGVSRSQITRWLRGAGIDPLNAEKVDLLELVWSSLLRLYARDAAVAWLFGINPRLGDRRPIDLVRSGRAEELMRAIRAERADSFA
jgi:transcriptional regulator with XRE-family HTH domain